MTVTPAMLPTVIAARCGGRDKVADWFELYVETPRDAGMVAAACCGPVEIYGRSVLNAHRALSGKEDDAIFGPDLNGTETPIEARVAQILAAAANGDKPAANALIIDAASDAYVIRTIALALVDQAHHYAHLIARQPGAHP